MSKKKPLGLDGKTSKVTIVQHWNESKSRMEYHTSSNCATGAGNQLVRYEELVSYMKHCLAFSQVIEILPDYDRPIGKNW